MAVSTFNYVHTPIGTNLKTKEKFTLTFPLYISKNSKQYYL